MVSAQGNQLQLAGSSTLIMVEGRTASSRLPYFSWALSKMSCFSMSLSLLLVIVTSIYVPICSIAQRSGCWMSVAICFWRRRSQTAFSTRFIFFLDVSDCLLPAQSDVDPLIGCPRRVMRMVDLFPIKHFMPGFSKRR